MSFIINPFAFGGGPTSPEQLAGLVRWYKADTYALSDGDPVGDGAKEWLDQSPAAPNNANQLESTGFRPVFRTNVFGSQPALQFTHAGLSFLTMPALVLPGDFTVIVIGKYTNQSSIIGKRDNATRFNLRHSSGISNDLNFNANGGSNTDSDLFTTAESSVRMNSWRRNAGPISYRENNIDRGTFSDSVISITVDTLGIDDGGLGKTEGHFSEICIYSQYHSDANINGLFLNYFKNRYTIP